MPLKGMNEAEVRATLKDGDSELRFLLRDNSVSELCTAHLLKWNPGVKQFKHFSCPSTTCAKSWKNTLESKKKMAFWKWGN